MASSNDVERLFLQAVFSRGILTEKLARLLWAKCVDAVQAADDSLDILHSEDIAVWHSFVTRLNNSINDLQLEFHHSEDELGKSMYTLVNRKDDAIAQMAGGYSPVEIAYFKAIIEQIMLAPNEAYSVSSLAALREVSTLKPSMSKTQAEVVLSSFVAKGWLFKSRRGRYSLSTRTLIELSFYLKDAYPDEANECTICMELVTRGVACNTMNCKARMHCHCLKQFLVKGTKCPACDEPWPKAIDGLLPVGEAAVKPGQDEGRRRVSRKSADDEEDEDTHDEQPSQPTQSQAVRRTQRSRGVKAKKEKIDFDEDDELDEDIPQASGNRRTTRRRG